MDDFTGLLVYSQCCATKTQGCARLDNIIGHTNSMLFSCPHLGQSLLFELSFSGVFNHTSQDLAVFLARDTTDITFKLNLICPCVEQTNHDVSALNAALHVVKSTAQMTLAERILARFSLSKASPPR
jgi:hypothetical protein